MADNKDPNNNSEELENTTASTEETSSTASETNSDLASSANTPNDDPEVADFEEDDDTINHGNIQTVNLVEELKSSYLDYAMSVIMGRALPDARDGFKPVHRRVIYAMHKSNLSHSSKPVKSAEIVGKVMGLYHPHGDSAIYDTLVRMAQDFSLKYPLVIGQGNFGGRGGESPAAMRYTEATMSLVAEELVKDIDKQTVDFIPNYSNKELEPVVLPTRIPNLLVNGSSGIAVGMATSIPPHNLSEVINGCLAYLVNPDISIDELMKYIPAPDFPTKGIILGKEFIREAYHTGRGKLYIRAAYEVFEQKQTSYIRITELPYQVTYTRIIEHINDLSKSGEVEGIVEVLNFTKDEPLIQIKVHRDHDPHVVMNRLFAKTALQTSISFNMLALNSGKPELLNLKQFIQIFIDFRREVITRRSVFELEKARKRIHILEALSVALHNIDEIINIIRSSQDSEEASTSLRSRGWKCDILKTMINNDKYDPSITKIASLGDSYGINSQDNLYYLSKDQSDAILRMPLSRLTGLEQGKITVEYQDLINYIIFLLEILNNPEKLNEVLRDELIEVRERVRASRYDKDARQSIISDASITNSEADFVTKEEVVVTITRDGYIKSQSLSEYSSQKRGGKGKFTGKVKDEDIVENMVVGNSVDTLLMFTNYGRVYSIPAYKIPRTSTQSRGRALVNIIPFLEGEKIATLLAINEDDIEEADNKYLVFATEKGLVKKTKLSQFTKIRQTGIICFMLNRANVLTSLYGLPTIDPDDPDISKGVDRLAQVVIGEDQDTIFMVSGSGFVNAFNVDTLSPASRRSLGVIGMKVQSPEDRIVGMFVASRTSSDSICTITASGYAKRTELNLIPVRKSRGGSGVKIHKLNDKVATEIMATTLLNDDDQLAIITSSGKMLRANATQVPCLNRISQGVLTIRLDKNEFIVDIERIIDGVKLEAEGEYEEETTEATTTSDATNSDTAVTSDTTDVASDNVDSNIVESDSVDSDNTENNTDNNTDTDNTENDNL